MSDCVGYRLPTHPRAPEERVHCTGCADAAALQEQLGRVSNEVLRLTNHVAHLGMDLATAEALARTNSSEAEHYRGLANEAGDAALTNGEARWRAEAALAERERMHLEEWFALHGRDVAAAITKIKDAEARAATAEAENGELRGLLEDAACVFEVASCDGTVLTAETANQLKLRAARIRAFLAPAAIPEGTPTK